MRIIATLCLLLGLLSSCDVVYAADPSPALKETFGNEGGLTKDDGGWTKYGISQRGSGLSEQQIKALTLSTASTWYLVNVWKPLGLDRCRSQIIANEIFDSAVNEGTGTAARRIQQAINLSNGNKPDIKVDGKLGAGTWAAWAQCDMVEFYVNWIILRGTRYQQLVIHNPAKFQQYFKSWTYRLKNNVKEAVHEYENAD
jgi:lysozyme family protein